MASSNWKQVFAQARANRAKRSPLQVGLSTGLLITAIIVSVLLMKYFQPDQILIILFAILAIGILVTIRTVRSNPKNKADVKDEHETCMPILERYQEKRNVRQLMKDYKEWWAGEHSNYTRMHFAEKIIEILQERHKYEAALKVLYQVAELPLKGRDHYDYDNYLRKMEPILKEQIEEQRKAQGKLAPAQAPAD